MKFRSKSSCEFTIVEFLKNIAQEQEEGLNPSYYDNKCIDIPVLSMGDEDTEVQKLQLKVASHFGKVDHDFTFKTIPIDCLDPDRGKKRLMLLRLGSGFIPSLGNRRRISGPRSILATEFDMDSGIYSCVDHLESHEVKIHCSRVFALDHVSISIQPTNTIKK